MSTAIPQADHATIPETSGENATTAVDAAVVAPERSRGVIIHDWLAANPLVMPALGLVAGIFIDVGLPVGPWIAVLVFAAAGGLLAVGRQNAFYGWLALLLAAASVGTVLHDLAFRRWPADHVVKYAPTQGVAARLSGTVVSSPLIRNPNSGSAVWYPQTPRTRFVLSACSIGGRERSAPVSGLVSVIVREPLLDVSVGDRIELVGTFRRIAPPSNPGSVDWSLVNRRKRILVELSCRRAGDLGVIARNPWDRRTWLDGLRARARAGMLEGAYEGEVPGSGLLAGMVLGQRSAIDSKLNEAFIRSGTIHYLSVSGAHVAMLAGTVWTIGWLAGFTRRRCAGWAMLVVTGYAVMAEPSAPIVRAAMMTDLACLCLLLRKPPRAANCLALSAIVLLVAGPTQLFDAGFQLSYVTLLALIYVSPRMYYVLAACGRKLTRRDDPLLAPKVQQLLGMRSPRWAYWDRAVRAVGWYVAIGWSAAGVGAMLTAFHFYQVQSWGWINSILLAPLIWLVMVLGLIKAVAAPVVPWLSESMGGVLAWFTDLLIGLVEAMARLPAAAIATPAVPAWLVAFGLAVVCIWTLAPKLRLPKQFSRVLALFFLVAAFRTLAPPGPQDSLSVDVLAVGNGSATVIRLPNGKTLMYDVGCFPPYDLEKWTVGPVLSQQNCWRVDAVLLSHANLDHYCGLAELMDRRVVRRVVTTPHFEHAGQTRSATRNLIARLTAKEGFWRQAARGDTLVNTGEAELQVLWPPRAEIATGESNDTSMVLRISFAGKSVLACGDIEEFAIQQLLATTDIGADVLLLPHHGSVTPSTAAFVRAVNPTWCIRSTGRRETSQALRDVVAGREYFSTAEHGAIRISIDREQLTVAPAVAN